MTPSIEKFASLLAVDDRFAHGFVQRVLGVEVGTDKEEVLKALAPWHKVAAQTLGWPDGRVFTADQTHGAETVMVTEQSLNHSPIVDGLMTNISGLLLGIHVADCAPVYIVDPKQRAVALLHSGRKGTDAGITPRAIAKMAAVYESCPRDLIVQIGPCIRPPRFEIDIAALIRCDCVSAGVPQIQVHDCYTCTGADLNTYYSYRMERGRTGRLLALLGIR